jgi:hypothetical protein
LAFSVTPVWVPVQLDALVGVLSVVGIVVVAKPDV